MPADGPEAPRDATTPRILRIEVDLTEAPEMAFARRVQGFADGSRRSRIRVPARPAEPAVVDGTPVGRVLTVRAPKELTLELRPAKGWGSERPVRLRWTGSPHGGGSRVVAEIEGWEELLSSDGHGNLLDWASESFFPHLLDPFGAQSLGDWAADRAARRPTGAAARENYRDPPYHGPNFHLILDRLGLTPSDRLLEVACGGGAFLHRALESGGTASAIDHTPRCPGWRAISTRTRWPPGDSRSWRGRGRAPLPYGHLHVLRLHRRVRLLPGAGADVEGNAPGAGPGRPARPLHGFPRPPGHTRRAGTDRVPVPILRAGRARAEGAPGRLLRGPGRGAGAVLLRRAGPVAARRARPLPRDRGRAPPLGPNMSPRKAGDRAGALARIRRVIASVPRGRVITYGWAAEAAGYPRSPRLTVHALRHAEGLPWHRVVAAGGRIALPGVEGQEQRFRLTLEGVSFRGPRVRIDRHGWIPRARTGRLRDARPPRRARPAT